MVVKMKDDIWVIDMDENEKSYEKGDEYRCSMKQTLELLTEMSDNLYDHAFYLAAEGQWKEWSDSQPVGTTTRISSEMLYGCNDDNVRALLLLEMRVREIVKMYKNKLKKDNGLGIKLWL